MGSFIVVVSIGGGAEVVGSDGDGWRGDVEVRLS